MARPKLPALALFGLAALVWSAGCSTPPKRALTIEIPTMPTPVTIGDAQVLAYELVLTNVSENDVRLRSLTAGWSGGRVEYDSDDLTTRTAPDRATGSGRPTTVGPGRRAFVHMWLEFGAGQVPPDVFHTISGGTGDPISLPTISKAPTVTATGSPPTVLAAPVRGGEWLVVNGPSNDSGHRRHVAISERKAYFSQRFALDLIRETADGGTMQPDDDGAPRNLSLGREVLAGADGVVAAVRDGIPDNRDDPDNPDHRAVEIVIDTLAGNHVVLDVGDGRFVFYGHLRQGSIRVTEGDRVTVGQIIGRIGNSGNSTEPHLHLHVADGPHPLHAQGLPFVFEEFEAGGQRRLRELPGDGARLTFPGGSPSDP